ncbi:MAG: serine hydrolase [Cytophagia bacterium]|nr:serine hydrolase [Cytophagia bacterium]
MNKITLPLLLLLALTTACSGPAKESSESEPQIIDSTAKARLDSTLNAFVQAGKVAGASSLIYEDGKEVYFNAFGEADQEAQRAMDRSTIAIIYSMTKPITGTALMTLYEQGAFELDDPLSKYLPEYGESMVFVGLDNDGKPILEKPKRPITVRDITRHTAGFSTNRSLPDLGPIIAAADAGNRNNTLAEMSQKLAATPLWFHPGEKWEYGPSVDVQAYLVEKISGMPYHEYVRANVLDPLGMTETRYVVPEEDLDRLSGVYNKNSEGELSQIPNEQAHSFNVKKWPLTPGGYGLTSTLDDYMKFAQMLVNGGTYNGTTILKPETVKLMATNHLDESVEERSWLPSKGQVGFGIDFAVRLKEPATPEENNGAVGEFFWDGAATTLFWVDPLNKLTAVFFVQVMPFDGTLHKDFRDAVYGPIK